MQRLYRYGRTNQGTCALGFPERACALLPEIILKIVLEIVLEIVPSSSSSSIYGGGGARRRGGGLSKEEAGRSNANDWI